MATLNYARASSGKLASAIGWINFAGISINQSSPTRVISLTVPGGATLDFTLRGVGTGTISGTAIPTWSGAAMGVLGYTNIAGSCALTGVSVDLSVYIENISFKDRFSNTIPNFQFYFTDAEATASASSERLSFSSDKIINQVDHYPQNYPCPSYTGEGTNQVVMGGVSCTGTSFNSRIFQTIEPTSIIANIYTSGGAEAMALGLSIQQMALQKVVTNRIDASDQFQLELDNISQSINLSTITVGTSTGLQNQSLENFGYIGDIYKINENMASGSLSSLSQYVQTISIVNNSGGSIPTGVTLGGTLPLNTGDFLVVKIINTPNFPYIKPVKSVSKTTAFQGDVLDYTIVLANTSPNSAINVILNDTNPSGTTLIPNSININGIPTTEVLPNINVGTIPENTVTTVTFKVSVNTTIPKISPISNSGTAKYNYVLATTTPSLAYTSNIVQTTIIDSAKFIGTKTVDKTTAKFSDILTYTLAFLNTGTVTATNLSFIDTIPTNTTFIQDSLKVNGNTLFGQSPNYPGVALTIPSSVASNGWVTVSFKVLVNTIINPDTIINYGSLNYNFLGGTVTYSGVVDTNTVATTVKYLDVEVLKSVDKAFSYQGDTITYTVEIKSVGNLIGENVIFKDTISNNVTFINGSLEVDGVPTSGDLVTGINIGNMNKIDLHTITFKVRVN